MRVTLNTILISSRRFLYHLPVSLALLKAFLVRTLLGASVSGQRGEVRDEDVQQEVEVTIPELHDSSGDGDEGSSSRAKGCAFLLCPSRRAARLACAALDGFLWPMRYLYLHLHFFRQRSTSHIIYLLVRQSVSSVSQ